MFRSRLRSIALWLVGAVAAVLVGVASAEPVLRDRIPAAAIGLNPFDGLSRAAAIDQRLKVAAGEHVGQPDWRPGVDAGELREARLALANEPASVEALRLIGYQTDAAGNRLAARRIIEVADGFSRRDLLTTAWLIDDASKRSVIAPLLRQLDIGLRIDQGGQSVYLPILARALAHPESVPLGIALLRQNPPWLNAFLLEAAQLPAGLASIADIRRALPRAFDRALIDRDAGLVASLTASDPGKALVLVDRLAPRPAGREIVRDARFTTEPRYPPIDWQLVSEGDYGAARDRRQGGLLVSGVAAAGGSVARQIVELAPGRYRLGMVRSDSGTPAVPTISIRCRTQALGDSVRLLGNRPVAVAAFDVPASCRYFLVDIEVPVGLEEAYDLKIDRVSLMKVG